METKFQCVRLTMELYSSMDLHRQVVHVDIVNSTNPGITVRGVAKGGPLKQGP